MTNKIKLSFLTTALTLSSVALAAEDTNRDRYHSISEAIQSVTQVTPKEVSVVDNFRHMFENGKTTGNIRSIYSSIDNKNALDTDATAVGLHLKYELAELNGFNAAAAFTTTHDVNFLSGDNAKRNNGLSGTKGNYSEITESYLNYANGGLNLRIGRQVVDTPLADSDDIRMVPNTFEAYIANYEIDSLSFMAGHLQRWQGADADLDNSWVKNGEDGVSFVGATYAGEVLETSAWYYDISNASTNDIANGADANGNKSTYVDFTVHLNPSENIFIHTGAQYLSQSEMDNSGVEAKIYGLMAEIIIEDLGIYAAYNKSTKQMGKRSFSGYGGGTLFTNMDTMILDEITEDRDAKSFVASLSYSIADVNFLYAYGDFKGEANTSGTTAHITEQNFGVEYTPNEDLTLAAILVKDKNKDDATSTDFNNDNFRILASYNF